MDLSSLVFDLEEDIDDTEFVQILINRTLSLLHTTLPARVVSYDHEKQWIVCQPILAGRQVDKEEETITAVYPGAIPNVPVMFPSGGGFCMTWPLQKGDPVWLVVAERSISEHKRELEDKRQAQDPRRFDLQDCVAIPAGRPLSHKLTRVSPTRMLLGEDGTTGDGKAYLELGGSEVKIHASGALIHIDANGDVIVEPAAGRHVKLGGGAIEALAKASATEAALASLAASVAPLVAAWNLSLSSGNPFAALPPSITPYSGANVGTTKSLGE